MSTEPADFAYDPDVASHQWLQDRIIDPDERNWQALYHVIPDGYEAYARIFHRAQRDRIIGELTWQQLEADAEQRIYHHDLQTEDEPVRWAQVAETFGTVMHPQAQWHRLIRQSEPYNHGTLLDDAGWRYSEPQEGSLDLAQLGALAEVLVQHTETPAETVFAIWEGWGGLTSSDGYMVMRFYGGIRGRINSWRHKLMRNYRGPVIRFNRPAKPGTGALDVESSSGPRLELPNRNYILFEGDLQSFADGSWVYSAPWLREGDEMHPQTPSLIWPADQAWVAATEIDFDSTVVAGNRELIDQLLQHPDLEALEISIETDLTHLGDTINAPSGG